MYNSVKVFIFTILISSIAILFSYQNRLYGRLIEKSSSKLENFQIDLEILEQEWEEEEREDISSKLNINFVDFTLFKKPALANLLKPEYNWMDLDIFRLENGFVMDIDIYREFFREDIPFEEIFTLYNIPNINNCSDSMAELYYLSITEDEYKAKQFKELLQKRRRDKKPFKEKELKQLSSKFDKVVLQLFSTQPVWNREYTHSILSETISSMTQETQKTWLGERTTFFKIYLENEEKVDVELIYRWNEEDKTYKLFKLERIQS